MRFVKAGTTLATNKVYNIYKILWFKGYNNRGRKLYEVQCILCGGIAVKTIDTILTLTTKRCKKCPLSKAEHQKRKKKLPPNYFKDDFADARRLALNSKWVKI